MSDLRSVTALRCTLVSSIMENSTDDYRIQSFDLDTQMLLKTALKGWHATEIFSLTYKNFSVIKCCNIYSEILDCKYVFVSFRPKFSEPGEGFQYHHGSVIKGPGVQQRGWTHLLHHCAGQYSLVFHHHLTVIVFYLVCLIKTLSTMEAEGFNKPEHGLII